MATQTALTIATRGTANGAATADVTYAPVYASVPEKDGKGAITLESRWEERTAGASIGYSPLLISSRPANGSNLQLINMRLSIPTLEVSSPNTSSGYQPAPKQAYENTFKATFMLPSRATEAEKWELYARAKSAVDQAFLLAMAKSNEQVS